MMSSFIKAVSFIKLPMRFASTSDSRFHTPARIAEYIKDSHLLKMIIPSWWEDMNNVKFLQGMIPIRMELLKKNLIDAGLVSDEMDFPRPFENLHILEVGCRGGLLSEAMANLGARVIAIDPDSEEIRSAEENIQQNTDVKDNLQFRVASVEEFALQNTDLFDVIVASEVIEHVADRELFASSALRCLRPGGSVFFTTMNRTPMSGFYYMYLLEDVMKVMPKGEHDYEKLVRPKEIADLFRKHNCITTNVDGFALNPFTGSWFRIGFPHLNFALHAIKQTTH